MTTTQTWVDFYDILNLPETADDDRIKDAIRSQRRLWNKRAGQADPTQKQLAERRISELADAERTLLEAGRRQQYDSTRGAERARAAADNSRATSAEGNADWLTRARNFLSVGNAHSANYAAREAIATNGADHEAWSIRANSSFMLGDYRDAGFEFREAIRLQPQNASYHFDYGDAMCGTGEYTAALAEYETALRLDPGNPAYKTAIANLYLQTDRPAEALALMEDVVKVAPDNEFFAYYLAWALHEVTLSKWSQLINGRFAITSEEQIRVTKEMTQRALALRFVDDKLRSSLQENMELALKAEETVWSHSGNLTWYLGGLAVSLLMVFSGYGMLILIGILSIAGIVLAYVTRHRKPQWRFTLAEAPIVKAGI